MFKKFLASKIDVINYKNEYLDFVKKCFFKSKNMMSIKTLQNFYSYHLGFL